MRGSGHTQSSLDRYAFENPQKKNATDLPLDPGDKLFDQLRDIAQSKPFKYSIEGDARSTTETPPSAFSSTAETQSPAPEKETLVEPTAEAAPPTNVEMVPAALYTSALERLETMEEMNIKLYDTLDSAYDRIASMNTELLALTKHVANKLESPATILNSMTSTLKAANSVDGQPLPTTVQADEQSAEAVHYKQTKLNHE